MSEAAEPILWQPEEAARALGGRLVGAVRPATGASIDTRTLAPGDLFFAIQGEARDGHDFVSAAQVKGAAAAVVAESRAGAFEGPLIVVPDVLAGLGRMGEAARGRVAAKVVAVTGSVGKTGSKEALRLVFERQGATHASVASYNNHWGVPLTLARMPRETRFAVFEVGMNHSGEIAPLTRLIRPDIALVTTIEPVHIEHFRSIAGIADAKGEIFEGIAAGGVAVLPRDNPQFERLRAHALASATGRCLTFGEHERAEVRAERILLKPDLSIVEARVLGEPLTYRLGTPGRHIAINSLGVLAVAAAAGADLALAGLALAQMKPPAGRGERSRLPAPGGDILLVDESYNANPASVRATLATLAGIEPGPRGRRIAVLGDMLELGPEGPAMHRGLAAALDETRTDLVFAAGPLMANLVEALPPERRGGYAQASTDLAPTVAGAVRAGDVVMIKGSRGIRMERVVEALRARFSGEPGAGRD